MNENDVIPYIEPIFRFCRTRLSDIHDAEDLAGDIIVSVLEGMKKYEISSLDAWVWRVAHNRYARLVDGKRKDVTILCDEVPDIDDENDEDDFDEKYDAIFRFLHTLSKSYRDIFVDYYVGELTVRELAKKYSLSEPTVKWRLNVGREKIRERIGENKMDKIYNRLHWNTKTCNGSFDPDEYLHRQICRAICEAAYEKPLNVEQISVKTGIPAMYIEDELPRLIYGDAIEQVGDKYQTNFIVFHLADRQKVESAAEKLVAMIADKFEAMFEEKADDVLKMSFYGHDFGMKKLGYVALPYIIRNKLRKVKKSLGFENGEYPMRHDGGRGWYVVEETADENENLSEYASGCNTAGDYSGSKSPSYADAVRYLPLDIYYYWIAKYFDDRVYHGRGTRWLCVKGIVQSAKDGVITSEISDEDAARLIESGLVSKTDVGYKLNFACFKKEEFFEFVKAFEIDDESIDSALSEWIRSARKSFESFVPKRLESQINQWVSSYISSIIGYVTDELIRRGALEKPTDKPLTCGVFAVNGPGMNP